MAAGGLGTHWGVPGDMLDRTGRLGCDLWAGRGGVLGRTRCSSAAEGLAEGELQIYIQESWNKSKQLKCK